MQPNQPDSADSGIATETSLNKRTSSEVTEFVSLSTGNSAARTTVIPKNRFLTGRLVIVAAVVLILGVAGVALYFMRSSLSGEQAFNVDRYPVSSLGLEKSSTPLSVPGGASELAVNGDVSIAGILSLSDEAIANLGETLTNKVTIQDTFPGTPQAGNVRISGSFGAGNYVGSGAGLTGLSATNIASGTLANARLSPEVSLLGQTIEASEIQSNIVSSINGVVNDGGNIDIIAGTNVTVTTAGNTITISSLAAGGGGISEILVGSGLIGGGSTPTVNIDIDSSVVTMQGNTFNGAGQLVQLNGLGQLPAVNASQLTNLNASALSGGTVNDARLSANVALKNGQNIFTPSVDSTGVFRVQNAAATIDVLRVDSSNNRVGIGFGAAVAPNYTLDVNGDINIAAGSAFRIGGVAICTSGGCAAAAGSSDYIQNSASLQSSANFFISSASASDITARIRGAAGQTANLLQLEDAAGSSVFSVGPTGNTTVLGTSIFRPSTTTSALRVQNSSATVDVLRVDTQNGRIGIGYGVAVPPNYLLDVNGDINIAAGSSYRIGGTQICTASGCLVSGGSGDYIQNGTVMQTANFAIQSANAASIAARIRGASGQVADLLSVESNSGTALMALSAQGQLTIQPTTNSAALTVLRADGISEALRVDTSTNQTVIGDNGTTGSGALRVEATGTQVGLAVNSGGTGNLLNLSTSSTSILISSTGQASFTNGTNSTTAFRIQDASSNTLLQVDTSNNRINLGGGALAAQLGVTTSGTKVGQIINNTGTGNSLEIKKSSVDVFTVSDTGEVLIQPSTNTSTAVEVKNSSGANVLQVATGNSATNSTPSMTFNGSLIGELGSWTERTNTANARAGGASVNLNGYIYQLGGQTSGGSDSNIVRYATLYGNGSTSSWTSTTVLPTSSQNTGAVTYNGYIYAANYAQNNIYYARPAADGSIASWTTSSVALPNNDIHPSGNMVVANGYLYIATGGGVNHNQIYRAKINANGSLEAFTVAATLPGSAVRHYSQTVVSNGYLIVMGGYNASVIAQNSVYTFQIGSDGTLGAGVTTTGLPSARFQGSAFVLNGFVYYAGGNDTTSIYYSRINSDGTFTSWTTAQTTLTEALDRTAATVANGYVYFVAGEHDTAVTSTVHTMTAPRVQLGGTLDLIGISNGTLANGSGESGGSVSAGNISAAGQLTVAGNTTLAGGATVRNLLQVQGDAAFRAASAASTQTLQVQDSSGNVLFNVDSANRAVSVGTVTATAALTVSSNAANNLFQVVDATTPTTVFNLGDGGAATFRTQTNSSVAFLIQNSAGTNQFVVDTANNVIRLGNAGSSFDIKLGGTGQVRNAITRDFTCTSTEQVNDIVVFNAVSSVARTTSANSNRVAGVVTAKPSTTTCTTAIAGVVAVWFSSNAAPVTIGDPIVTSTVSGAAQSTTTPSAGAMLGNSLSTKDGSNLVWVRLR